MQKVKKFIANITASILVSIFFLFILEMIFRVIAPQELSGSWRTISDKGYMLNKASWESKHQLHGRKVRYKFNRFHQRSEEVAENKYKVMVLGDSFTFGWLLNEDKTYLAQLQKYADEQIGAEKVQIINAAAGGWGLADFLDYIEEFGDSVKPDMVVVYINTDDIGRSMNRNKFFNPDSKGASFKKLFNDSKTYQWLLENSHLVQWTRNRLVNISQKKQEAPIASTPGNAAPNVLVPTSEVQSSDEALKGKKLAETIFSQISDWCKARNTRLVVVTTGWHFSGGKAADKNDPEMIFIESAPEFFSKHNIPFKDLTPLVKEDMKLKGENEFIITGDYHPNEKGAQVIAKHSWQFLHEELKKGVHAKN